MTQILTGRQRLLCSVAALCLAGCAAPPPVAPPRPATIEAPAVAAGTAGPSTTRPAAAGYIWSDRLAASAQHLRSSLQGGAVVSQTTDQRLWVSLPVGAAFASGRAALQPPARTWLDQVAASLKELPRSEVQIVSDADSRGSDTHARTLALERAASARDWLVIRGVAAQRISVAARNTGVAASAEAMRVDILVGERARNPGDAAR